MISRYATLECYAPLYEHHCKNWWLSVRLMLHSAPGLDAVLWREVRSLDPEASNQGSRLVGGRNSLLLVDSDEPETLLRSRIAEDVYVLIAHSREIGLSRRGLDDLAMLARKAPGWDEALRTHARITGGRGRRRTSTFRVISRAQGERAYKRSEAGEAVSAGLAARLGKNWKSVADDAQVEVWLTLIDAEALVGVRLTTSTQRHREKSAHIPASLRPSVAAALVHLSLPRDDDVFLDPFCGAGTILLERARAGRHQLLIGSDSSEDALLAARENIGERHKPLELHNWNATDIPLEDASVAAIVSNLPFGEQVGTHEENERLYPRFLAEAHRLLPPSGRLVVLSSEYKLLRQDLSQPMWTITGRHQLRVLGKLATIFAARRN